MAIKGISLKGRALTMKQNYFLSWIFVAIIVRLIPIEAYAADRSKRYICTAEISRAFGREANIWRDYGSQHHAGFLVRALHPNELLGPDQPDITWGIFPPGPDVKPTKRCHEYAARLDCGYPGNSVSITFSEGRFAETLYEVGKGDFIIGISAGFCREINAPGAKNRD